MSTSINLDGYGLKSSDVAAIQAICLAVMAENPTVGGGGAVNYGDLLDATTVNLPVVNGPLAAALAAVSGGGGGSSTWAGLTDKTTAALPTDNAPLSTALGLKAPLASPTFTGTPAAPTASAATNTTQLATTAHVFAERTNTATLTNKTLTAPTLSGTVSGTYTMPTTATIVTIPPAADDTLRPAPTAWVNDAIGAAFTSSGDHGLSQSLAVLGESNFGWAVPVGLNGTTTPNVQGVGSTVTLIDTCTAVTAAAHTDPAQSRVRQRVAAAAVGPRAAGYLIGSAGVYVNYGANNTNWNGRFPVVVQAAVADAFGGTFFIGLQGQVAASWAPAGEPSAMTVDNIGFGWDSTDGNGFIYCNDNVSTPTRVDLGATDFDNAQGTVYQVIIDKNYNGTSLTVQVVNLNTGVASAVSTFATNTPRSAIPLYITAVGSCLVTNARSIDFAGFFFGKFPSTGGSGVGIRVPKIVSANTYTLLQSDKGLDIYFTHATSTAVTIPTGLTVGVAESDDGYETRIHRRRTAGPVTVAAPHASLTFNEVAAGGGTYTLTGLGEFLTVQALSATEFEGL